MASFGSVLTFGNTEDQVSNGGKMVKIYPKQADLLPYWLYVPEDYNKNKANYPVVVFLHGLGERGNQLDEVCTHGLPKLIAKGKHFPFIMIAPQCPNDGDMQDEKAKSFWWKNETVDKVMHIIDFEMARLKRIDKDRITITGLSMGGFGCYKIVHLYPNVFAGVAPICGDDNSHPDKKDIVHIPFWAFHGEKDEVVPLADQQKTIDALKKAGAQVTFTIYDNVGHNSWEQTYVNPKLYHWLLAQNRKCIKGVRPRLGSN